MATQDGYELYYTEKLWNWIPGFYREEDAYTDSPGTLRGIVESLGEQSAELRRFLDRLWENNFVELADDDALVKLGELVATRMVHELNRRARRVDVARTIYYRRRKGTPWVLERLINDIAGWTGSHLETRRRLARCDHLLEPSPAWGPVTQTPRGGWANLHSPRIQALAWTGFEELNHTPDFRRYHGHEGRFGIPKVGVHVHRMRALKVDEPTVAVLDAVNFKYALDPSGRAVPLFQPADRPTADNWTRPREWQMPKQVDRRLLADVQYEWTEENLEELGDVLSLSDAAIALLAPYAGYRFRNDRELERLFAAIPASAEKTELETNWEAIKEGTLASDCGSSRLYGSAILLATGANNDAAVEVPRQRVLIANLDSWGTNIDASVLSNLDVVLDPVTGAVLATSDPTNLIAPLLHYGAAAELGAGTYSRRASIVTEGVVELDDGGSAVGPVTLTPSVVMLEVTGVDEVPTSKTYSPPDQIDEITEYTLQAADLRRPYLLVKSETATWTLTAKVKSDPEDLRTLVLDGLWIGIEEDPVVSATEATMILAGTWDRVVIRHCTLDPGGETITSTPILPVTLEITGYVEELVIESSVVGQIVENSTGENPCSVGKITIRDSAVVTPDFVNPVIDTPFSEVHVERSTIVGDVVANRLYATDSLFGGAGVIADLQHGCFRFSAGVESNWPRPFESYFVASAEDTAGWVETGVFGQPNFLRLTERAPIEVREGAENHCEMGVYNKLIEPIKRADLRAKLDEFMPFDLLEQIVTEN